VWPLFAVAALGEEHDRRELVPDSLELSAFGGTGRCYPGYGGIPANLYGDFGAVRILSTAKPSVTGVRDSQSLPPLRRTLHKRGDVEMWQADVWVPGQKVLVLRYGVGSPAWQKSFNRPQEAWECFKMATVGYEGGTR
jgi:hypothetical protein